MPKGKILLIRGGAIGDFILTLPALAALRAQFPEAHLEVLGYPHIAQLALAGGLVDRVQSIDAGALAAFFARNGKLSEDLVDYFSEFDLVISYLYDPDEIFQTNVSRCTMAQYIQGPHRANDAEGVHAAKVYLKPLERLAIFDAPHVPQLRVSSSITEDAFFAAGVLALHPGSGSERKNWPEAQWAALLTALINHTGSERGHSCPQQPPIANLLLIGGEAEGHRLQTLAAALPPQRVRVAQSLPLPDLAAQLQNCQLFIGHDSGISHLAAALGLPGLLLWGDTRKEVWRPPSDKMVLLQHPAGLPNLPVETVFDTLTYLLKPTHAAILKDR